MKSKVSGVIQQAHSRKSKTYEGVVKSKTKRWQAHKKENAKYIAMYSQA